MTLTEWMIRTNEVMTMTPSNFSETLPNDVKFNMLLVNGGKFTMGGTDKDAFDREKPVHSVVVPSFYLAKYSVTQSVWTAVMGDNPSILKASNDR